MTDGEGRYQIVDLASRRLHGYLQPDGILDGPARRRRAGQRFHGASERRAPRRRSGRIHHGDRRGAGRRYAEHPAAADDQLRPSSSRCRAATSACRRWPTSRPGLRRRQADVGGTRDTLVGAGRLHASITARRARARRSTASATSTSSARHRASVTSPTAARSKRCSSRRAAWARMRLGQHESERDTQERRQHAIARPSTATSRTAGCRANNLND